MTGVDPKELRAAARLFATGGNGAIYYGLGVTEHSQGSTTVIAIANLAMATGNIGRPGVGVNPLRGQNNVQGSCDMGSFPHELLGLSAYLRRRRARIVRIDAGTSSSTRSRVCAFPTCSTPPSTAPSWAFTCRARTSCSPTPTPSMSSRRCRRWNASIVHDLFLNETANYAHVFLPGSTFLEKDGTFTNAERRIQRVRKVMTPRNGLADWEVTIRLGKAMGYRNEVQSSFRDHGRDRRPDADFRRRLLCQARRTRLGAVALQREGAGRHAGHAHGWLRARQGQVRHHRICRHRRAYRSSLSRCC